MSARLRHIKNVPNSLFHAQDGELALSARSSADSQKVATSRVISAVMRVLVKVTRGLHVRVVDPTTSDRHTAALEGGLALGLGTAHWHLGARIGRCRYVQSLSSTRLRPQAAVEPPPARSASRSRAPGVRRVPPPGCSSGRVLALRSGTCHGMEPHLAAPSRTRSSPPPGARRSPRTRERSSAAAALRWPRPQVKTLPPPRRSTPPVHPRSANRAARSHRSSMCRRVTRHTLSSGRRIRAWCTSWVCPSLIAPPRVSRDPWRAELGGARVSACRRWYMLERAGIGRRLGGRDRTEPGCAGSMSSRARMPGAPPRMVEGDYARILSMVDDQVSPVCWSVRQTRRAIDSALTGLRL